MGIYAYSAPYWHTHHCGNILQAAGSIHCTESQNETPAVSEKKLSRKETDHMKRVLRQPNGLLALFDEEIQDLSWLHLSLKEAEDLVGAEEVQVVQEASALVAQEWRKSALDVLISRYGFDQSWYRMLQMGQPAPR